VHLDADNMEYDDNEFMFSYSCDEGMNEDQQTIEAIAFAFKAEFRLIEIGVLSEAHLKMLALVLSARFGVIVLATYLY
jgi:hypothetical protein